MLVYMYQIIFRCSYQSQPKKLWATDYVKFYRISSCEWYSIHDLGMYNMIEEVATKILKYNGDLSFN